MDGVVFGETGIITFHIAESTGQHTGIVKSGIKLSLFLLIATLYSYLAQCFRPVGCRLFLYFLEVPSGNLCFQIFTGIFNTGERGTYFYLYAVPFFRSEFNPGPYPVFVPFYFCFSRCNFTVFPCSEGVEIFFKPDDEISAESGTLSTSLIDSVGGIIACYFPALCINF